MSCLRRVRTYWMHVRVNEMNMTLIKNLFTRWGFECDICDHRWSNHELVMNIPTNKLAAKCKVCSCLNLENNK